MSLDFRVTAGRAHERAAARPKFACVQLVGLEAGPLQPANVASKFGHSDRDVALGRNDRVVG